MTQFKKKNKKFEAGDKIGYSDIPKFRNISSVTADGMSQEGLGPEEELPAGNVDFHRENHKPVFSLRIKFLSHDINYSPRNTHLVWWCWTISPALAAGLRQGNGGAGPSPQHSGRGRGKREVHTREGQILSMQTVASIS